MEEIPLAWMFAALGVLLALSAFFSIAETAMMAFNRYRLKHLVAQGHRGALMVAELLKRTDRLLEEFKLAVVRRQPAWTLSGGERRRVEIARALALEPAFLLLDEPFTGIDPRSVQELQQTVRYLRERGLGVVITDHNVRDTLAITDRVEIIHEGRILLSGGPKELLQSAEARRLYLGEGFRL